MIAPMFVVVPVLLAAAAVASALSSWRARRRLLARIRREWGHARDRARDMDAVADFFRLNASPVSDSLDDRTWNDLLMDDVFAHLDRTESSVGQQVLYRRLRQAVAPKALDSFDALIARVSSDADRRERAQVVLARLQSSSAYYVHRLAQPDALERRPWYVVFPLWSAAVVLALALAFFWPAFLFAALFGVVVNRVILVVIARRFGGEIVWFRQVGPLLAAAAELAILGTEETAAITGPLASDLSALRRLGGVARWVSRDPLATDALTFAVLELLNMLLLMDANALYLAGREVRAKAPQLLRVIETVGEIDAAIAVASFREGADGWTRPTFAAVGRSAAFSEIRHPLVEDAVPNSIALAPPDGVLLTGSNMSGKSTFLRTVGVNVVLAQSVNTCLARRYEAPIYNVRSCIGRSDDLIAGKSYYLVEVESVLALVRASEETRPHLFIFDELFRGTNAVERIAAGEAVLRTLVGADRAHVVLAATHDAELIDLLRDRYVVYHLGDAIGPNGLTFDYRLSPGPATSRNAIALLRLNGAPESLVAHALERAAELDRQRQLLM
jgi:hypothetical protein